METEWHRIDIAGKKGIDFLREGQIIETEVNEKKICVARDGGKCFAVDPKCPHNGAALKHGYVEPGAFITCSLHRFRFSLETGKNTSGEGFYLEHYPVELRSDGMFVGFPTRKKFLGLF